MLRVFLMLSGFISDYMVLSISIGWALTSAHQGQNVTSHQTCFMWRCSWTMVAS